MCFDTDSSPAIPVVSGASVDTRRVTLEATDGNRFAGFEARGAGDGGATVLVLPDVRGLYRFYEELAVRFGERGYDAGAGIAHLRTLADASADAWDRVLGFVDQHK